MSYRLFCVPQILMENANQTLLVRLRIYISSYWNRLDCTCLILFLVGDPLANLLTISRDDVNKLGPTATTAARTEAIFREVGRVLLILSLLLYFVRLLYVFCIHKLFGPKIVMVGRMVLCCASLFLIELRIT